MKLEVMTEKEMKARKDALHIQVRDGKLYLWGRVDQEICVYPMDISWWDPDFPPAMTATYDWKIFAKSEAVKTALSSGKLNLTENAVQGQPRNTKEVDEVK